MPTLFGKRGNKSLSVRESFSALQISGFRYALRYPFWRKTNLPDAQSKSYQRLAIDVLKGVSGILEEFQRIR